MDDRRALAGLVLVGFCVLISTLTGQEIVRGSIRGRVIEKAGSVPLSQVRVTLLDSPLAAATGPEGTYAVPNVPPGTYQILFEKDGFLPALARVRVVDGRESTVNAVLEALHSDITVSASASERPETIASSGQILSVTEIKALPGIFEDVSRAVQVVPGVASAGDYRNDMIVRGGNPSENLFLIDKIQVPGLSHFGSQNSGGAGFFGLLNSNLVKNVEFYSGGFPAAYGDKLSSVTRVELREGNRTRLGGDVDFNLFGLSGNIEGPMLRGSGSWLVSLRKDYFFVIPKTMTLGLAVVPNLFDLQMKSVVDLSRTASFSLLGLAADDDIDIQETDVPESQRLKIAMRNHLYLLGGTFKWILGESGVVYATLSRTDGRNFYSESNQGQERYRIQSDEKETVARFDAEISLSSRMEILGGLSYRAVDADDHLLFRGGYMVIDRMGFTYTKKNMDAGLTSGKWAGYLQWTAALRPWLRATAGIRADRFEYIRQTVVGPRFGLSCDLGKTTAAHLSYGIVYQAPETFWIDSDPANKSLTYLKAEQAVLGFESRIGRTVKVTAEAFNKNYHNYPVDRTNPYQTLANLGGSFIPTYYGSPLLSVGTGFARGVELSAQNARAGRWSWFLDYSYSIAQYKALDGVLRNGDFDFRHLANAVVTYRTPGGWNLALKWRLIGGQPYTPFDLSQVPPRSGSTFDMTKINALRYPAYHRLDLRFEKTFAFKTWSLDAYLDIQNLYDRKNVYYKYWDDGQERTVYYLPLIPFLGLQASF